MLPGFRFLVEEVIIPVPCCQFSGLPCIFSNCWCKKRISFVYDLYLILLKLTKQQTECTWLKNNNLQPKLNVFILLSFWFVLDILQTVDPNVDPCDDFFLHACGGWIKNNPIPPNEPLWNQVLVLKTKNDQLLKTLLGHPKIRERYLRVSQLCHICFISTKHCKKLLLLFLLTST